MLSATTCSFPEFECIKSQRRSSLICVFYTTGRERSIYLHWRLVNVESILLRENPFRQGFWSGTKSEPAVVSAKDRLAWVSANSSFTFLPSSYTMLLYRHTAIITALDPNDISPFSIFFASVSSFAFSQPIVSALLPLTPLVL